MKNGIVFILISLIASCSAGDLEQEKTEQVANDKDEFRSFPIDVHIGKTNYSELIESVEVMRFQETDESPLSSIYRLHETDDFYVFPSGRDGDIFFYTKDGQFASKINRQGDGSEEYNNIASIWLENEHVCVYSRGKPNVKCYNFEGNFKSARGIIENGLQLVPYENGFLMNMDAFHKRDSLQYRIIKFNLDFEIDTLLLPFKKWNKVSINNTFNRFRPYKNGMTYLRGMCDTLYYVHGEQAIPLVHIDLGDDWLWNDTELLDATPAAINAMENRGQVWTLGANVHQRWVYLVYMNSLKRPSHLILDRITGEYDLVDFDIKSKEPANIRDLKWVGDRLLMTLDSDEVAAFLAGLNENQWYFREGTTLEEIESSENPVLLRVRFK